MEQMIKINVPDGMEAVWNDKLQKVEFVKKKSWRNIKTFNDVLRYLGLKENDIRSLYSPILNKCVPFNKWQLIMEAFIKASNDKCQLTEGKVYVPYYYIVYNKYIPSGTNAKVRSGIINNKVCTLVGGVAYGSSSGLGLSSSINAAANSYAYFGFCGFSSREVAEHVSKYFTWEFYESTLDWRTDEIEWR